jgi:DNA end-binding protein Ku
MTEPVWSGHLRLSLVSCPVRLAPASRRPEPIRLDPLNGRTGNPIIEQFVDAHAGDIVPTDVMIRGCQKPDGSYVRIANSELEALAGEADVIDVAQFCPAGQIDRARFDGSYYLYPEGALAAETLASLRLAMQRVGADAIGYLRLGERERLALIAPHDAGLMLTTLRPPRVLEPAEFTELPDDAVPPDMIETAEGIIRRRMLEGDANLLPDRYEERLGAFVEQKIAAAEAPPPEGEFDLDAVAPPPESGEPSGEDVPGRDLGAEILLHFADLGDRRFLDPGWTGQPGSRRQIEAISIRPRDEASPSAIQYQAFAQDGRATAWVSNGSYAGTRDRQLPLTGFAVRPAPEWRDHLDVVYEGRFFDGGVVGPKMNGEVCASPIANDPLEAVRVSIVARPDAVTDDTAGHS